MKKLALLICATILFIPGIVYGQCRPRYYTYTPPPTVVVDRFVEVPIAYPVLVPAFQFQYSPPCYAPAPAFAPAAPVGAAPMYQQHAPAVQQPQQMAAPQTGNMYGGNNGSQKEIAILARALLEEMRRQADQEQNGDGPPAVLDPTLPSNPPGFQQPPPQQSGGMTKEQAQPIALAGLSRACAACHTGIGSKGDTTIFTQPGVFNQYAPLRTMRREIEGGRMPPPSHNYRLTPTEQQALNIWLPQPSRKE